MKTKREWDASSEETGENGCVDRLFASLSVVLFAWEKICRSLSKLRAFFVTRRKG
ncbi:MAG: hypothetical protein PHV34_16630 [Verrucomicrobiae bacterium]|nr:hypothetical protein [Verrucomicrobiae bacterium]